jgi:hypothetical protein
MTKENDIVLIHLENEPIAFARVEHISPDAKKGWYQVKLLMLLVPLQVTTWILRDVYINGQEFTMGGKRVRLAPVVCPKDPVPPEKRPDAPEKSGRQKVISLKDLKKI